MEVLENRLLSFSKPKRVKGLKKQLKWPHSEDGMKATPKTLAEAGFYYDPSAKDQDNVSCFICGKHLSEWEPDDDPFDIHWEKCGTSCAWAVVRCALREDTDRHGVYTFPDPSRLPNTKFMEKARLSTFLAGDWPHDTDKNHGAASKKMARAGFIYTPQSVRDDLATCLYCNCSLSEWDSGDDPLAEHHKRQGKGKGKGNNACPFLALLDAAPSNPPNPPNPAAKVPARPSSRASTKPPSKLKAPTRTAGLARASSSQNLQTDTVILTKIHDGDPDADEDGADSEYFSGTGGGAAKKAAAKTPRKPRSTTTGSKTTGTRKRTASTLSKSRSQSRAEKLAEPEEEAVESEKDEEMEMEMEMEMEVVEEVKPTKKAKVKGKGKKKLPVEPDEEMEEPPQPEKKPRRTKSKLVARKVQQPEEVEEDLEEEPKPVPIPVKKKVKAKGSSTSIASKPITPPRTTPSPSLSPSPQLPSPQPSSPQPPSPVRQQSPVLATVPPVQIQQIQSTAPNGYMDVDASMLDDDGDRTGDTHTHPVASQMEEDMVQRHLLEDLTATIRIPLQHPAPVTPPNKRVGLPPAVFPPPIPATESQDVIMGTNEHVNGAQPTVSPLETTSDPPAPPTDANDAPAPEDAPEQPQQEIDYPIAPLSLLPFQPLTSLTGAELDMTVEEWIRYRMDMDFDKFRRDGEREVERFKRRAEEVRKIIEGL